MAVENIYKHSARSYYDVYNPLIQAYPCKPTWLFKEMAGLFDHQSELMNRIATDILYPVTRESAYSFAAMCDYDPLEADGATDTMTITLNSAMSKTLPIGYKFRGISSSSGKMVDFETTALGSSGGTSSISVAVKQKKTYTGILVATINNNDDFADYPVDGYVNIIKSSMSLTIDSQTWTRVDYFDDSSSTDKHFQLIFQSSGKVRIRFGDGTTGAKPTIGNSVYATFETTLGLGGRMDAGTVTINAGSDTDIASVTNAGSSGGNDSETVASIIRNARANVRFKQIIWSKEDLEVAARKASGSVQKALGVPSSGTATVYIVPSGGGNASAGLLSTVKSYSEPLTQFGAMTITVFSATYVTTNITATVTVRSGYTTPTVINLTAFALTLVASAIDNQVIEYYDEYGIDATRTAVINVIWTYAFTSSENDALEYIILKWKELLGTRKYRDFDQILEVGDLWVMGKSLYNYGVDVFNLTAPTSNVSVTSSQISNAGTVTVS